jgi:proteasome assembly chaperone (PAC2) family protein
MDETDNIIINNIIKQFVFTSLITMEKIMYKLCENNNIFQNLKKPQIYIILNSLIEDYINDIYHKLHQKKDNEIIQIFDELRTIKLLHPYNILEIVINLIANIYSKLNRDQLNIDNIDSYIESIKNQMDLIYIHIKHDLLIMISECNNEHPEYDENINPFKFEIEIK